MWLLLALLLLCCCLAALLLCSMEKEPEKRTFEVKPTPPLQTDDKPKSAFDAVTAPPKVEAKYVPPPTIDPYLPMWFQDKGCTGEEGIHEYKFFKHPLGLQFQLRAPVIINRYTADGVGAWA